MFPICTLFSELEYGGVTQGDTVREAAKATVVVELPIGPLKVPLPALPVTVSSYRW